MNIKNAIAIPSRARPERVLKLILNLISLNSNSENVIPIFLFVENNEYNLYKEYIFNGTNKKYNLVNYNFLYIIKHRKSNQGMGYVRWNITNYLYNKYKVEQILFIDDDIMIKTRPMLLFDELSRLHNTSLLGYWFPIYDKWYDNSNKYNSYGLPAFQAFSIKVKDIIDIGSFDVNIYFCEDMDLAVRLILNDKYVGVNYGCKAVHTLISNAKGGIKSMLQDINEDHMIRDKFDFLYLCDKYGNDFFTMRKEKNKIKLFWFFKELFKKYGNKNSKIIKYYSNFEYKMYSNRIN